MAMFSSLRNSYHGGLAKLSRIQGSSSLVPELESLRFVAIASVFFAHLNGYLTQRSSAPWVLSARGSAVDNFLRQGRLGVQLFFVISGFVLALPFARQRLGLARPVKLGAYYLRRLTRLEPPFLACLGLLFLAMVVDNRTVIQTQLPHLAATAVYLHAAIYHTMSTINGVTWSLEIEIQFYLVTPLLTLLFAVRSPGARRLVLIAVCLVVQALQRYLGLGDDRDNPTLLNYLPYFLMGFILADLYLGGWLTRKPNSWIWDLLLLTLAPMTWVLAVLQPHSMPIVLPWALLAIYAAFFRGRLFRWALSGRIIVTIGGMCYTIYLFHFAIVSAAARFTKDLNISDSYIPNLALQVLLIGTVTLILTSIFFALVERPCMRRNWPQRLWARVKAAVGRSCGRLPLNETPPSPNPSGTV